MAAAWRLKRRCAAGYEASAGWILRLSLVAAVTRHPQRMHDTHPVGVTLPSAYPSKFPPAGRPVATRYSGEFGGNLVRCDCACPQKMLFTNSMTDTFSPEDRRAIMKRIKSEDTCPEMRVRRFLHGHGLRFRLHSKELPGKPDIILRKYGCVVFVHGCFWHQHKDRRCTRSGLPKSNTGYWLPKLEKTVGRDKEHRKRLKELGWNVHVVWECQINQRRLENLVKQIVSQK